MYKVNCTVICASHDLAICIFPDMKRI